MKKGLSFFKFCSGSFYSTWMCPWYFQKALLFTCGSAVVCDTMDEARRLAFNSGERKQTVSIDGTMFEKSGVMSGGLGYVKYWICNEKRNWWDVSIITVVIFQIF